MDIEWKKYLVGIALSGAAGLGTTAIGLYRSVDARFDASERATTAVEKRIDRVEDHELTSRETLKRIEQNVEQSNQKLDYWILEDYRQHHQQPSVYNPPLLPDAILRGEPQTNRPLPSGNRTNP